MDALRPLTRGKYCARLAESTVDLDRALILRQTAFRDGTSSDEDAFDARCDHVLIELEDSQALVGCFRLLPLQDGAEIRHSYSAQFYDLGGFHNFEAPLLELGRFCTDPARPPDPDVLRLAWAAITACVEARGAEMIIGCSSFEGTDTDRYADCFALLRARHLAPEAWRPAVKSAAVCRFADLRLSHVDLRHGLAQMPPLLRSYLSMGGKVSDHAVIDADLNTIHVFTGLQISAIPAGRARVLRALAKS